MSRTVTGYQDGHPIYRDDGPAYARRAGFGGAAIGHYTTTFLVHQKAARGTVDPAAAASHRSAAAQRAVERKRAVRATEAERRGQRRVGE